MSNFFSLDTNGQLRYKSHTIDKYSTVPAVITGVNGSQSISPEHQSVNIVAYADSEFLYILSNMRSMDMTSSQFSSQNVIDLYFNTDGQYKGSIIIPSFQSKRVREFTISGKKLITLQGSLITIYKM